ncbi:dihydrofolate reductase [Leptospira meyeri]|nr:dihydrofolate reductase family protein [Leptospira meyeri]TGL53395.1 dihydrofolate reductase [Leptospira meyeri]
MLNPRRKLMGQLKVKSFSISMDGFGAGPNQSLENPLGEGAMKVHEWVFSTKSFQKMHGSGSGGELGIDNDFAEAGFLNIGAWILGRNMFGPIRGEWPNEEWKGWWGTNPPYHCPVYVLTNHPREPISMEGGTTFHFVTEGIHKALELAQKSAGNKDVRLGGGVSTIRQYLQEKLIDELHLVVSPVLLGRGESLLSGIDLISLGYELTTYKTSPKAMHLIIERKNG